MLGDLPRCVHGKRSWFSVSIRSKIVMGGSGTAPIDETKEKKAEA
jgi:hypothetical protein